MIATMDPMASTDSWVVACIPDIFVLISSVASAVCWASALISPATTANPLPASPARAASMVAFNARRLVCSEISAMVSVTLLISNAALPRSSTLAETCSAFVTAWAVVSLPLAVLLAISLIVADISSTADTIDCILAVVCSVAAATLFILVDISSDAAATLLVRSDVCPALAETCSETVDRSLEDVFKVSTPSLICENMRLRFCVIFLILA